MRISVVSGPVILEETSSVLKHQLGILIANRKEKTLQSRTTVYGVWK